MAFSPESPAITNLTPEHTDWHRTTEHYFADKLNLIDRDNRFRSASATAPRHNELVLAALRDRSRLLPPTAPFIDDRIASVAVETLKGEHNLDNARLAAQIALAAGAGLEGIVRGIQAFEPLPHRLEEHSIGGNSSSTTRSQRRPKRPRPPSPPIPARRSH